jgi:acetate kinase
MTDASSLPVLALNAGSSSLKFGFFLAGASGSRTLSASP